jgi:uncharacterized DUF497 family protein
MRVRKTCGMPDAIIELLVTEVTIDKLGARGITTHDARRILRNAHVVTRNPNNTSPGRRRLLIGRADGGRALTLVIEQDAERLQQLAERRHQRRRRRSAPQRLTNHCCLTRLERSDGLRSAG